MKVGLCTVQAPDETYLTKTRRIKACAVPVPDEMWWRIRTTIEAVQRDDLMIIVLEGDPDQDKICLAMKTTRTIVRRSALDTAPDPE